MNPVIEAILYVLTVAVGLILIGMGILPMP